MRKKSLKKRAEEHVRVGEIGASELALGGVDGGSGQRRQVGTEVSCRKWGGLRLEQDLEQALSKCSGLTPVFSGRFRGFDATLGLTTLQSQSLGRKCAKGNRGNHSHAGTRHSNQRMFAAGYEMRTCTAFEHLQTEVDGHGHPSLSNVHGVPEILQLPLESPLGHFDRPANIKIGHNYRPRHVKLGRKGLDSLGRLGKMAEQRV